MSEIQNIKRKKDLEVVNKKEYKYKQFKTKYHKKWQ